MQSIRKLRPGELKSKTVLLRVDFNVEDAAGKPSTKNMVLGKILDDYRIRAALPTIQFLLRCRAKLILMSHRGRPKGKNTRDSLRPVAEHLSQLLGRRVIFFETWEDLASFWRILPERTIGILENLRFWPGEESNDAAFAQSLAELGDVYVNDAFAVSHRKNASVVAITKYLPSYAGLLLEQEVKALDKLSRSGKSGLILIIGGAKMADKLPIIWRFKDKADLILTGGGIANTFLAAKGVSVGNSLVEQRLLGEARRMLQGKSKIVLPIDHRMGLRHGKEGSRADASLPSKKAILDIGPKTEKLYAAKIARARVILWNGPMGFFENTKFARGSYAVARAIAKNQKAFSVIGGGETLAAFRAANSKFKIQNSKLFLSTGGGAMLEYLAGKKLPGIAALERASLASVRRREALKRRTRRFS